MTTTNDPLESYIGRFQARLTKMTLAQRQDIVDEIRAHVHERVASSGLEYSGSAGETRPGGRPGAGILPRGRWSLRPAPAFRHGRFSAPLLPWAMTGAHGVRMLAIAFWGYAAALGMLRSRQCPPDLSRTDGDLDHARLRNGNGPGSSGRRAGVPR